MPGYTLREQKFHRAGGLRTGLRSRRRRRGQGSTAAAAAPLGREHAARNASSASSDAKRRLRPLAMGSARADDGPTPDAGPAAELDDERPLVRQAVAACVLAHRTERVRRRVRRVVNER